MSIKNSIFFCAKKYVFDLYMNIYKYFSCFKNESKQEIQRKRIELLERIKPKKA